MMNQQLMHISGAAVFREIQAYNEKLGDMILDNDLEGFSQCIDEFSQSGITMNPFYEDALIAYRMMRPHHFINGKPSDVIVQKLKEDDFFIYESTFPDFLDNEVEEMVSLASIAKVKSPKKRKPLIVSNAELQENFNTLIATYESFIADNETPDHVTDDSGLKKDYYSKYIVPMIDCRHNIDCTIDFRKFPLKGYSAEDKLYYKIADADTFEERLAAIHEAVEDTFTAVRSSGSKLSFNDFYEVKAPYKETKAEAAKYSDRQFMMGFFNHGAVTNMSEGKFIKHPFFPIALAMYLSIPTTDRIEKFINKFGYSMDSPFTCLWEKEVKGKTYHFYGHHFKKWFDNGIDYFLLYQLLCKEWGI